MIRLESLTKIYWVQNEPKTVIDNLSITLPTGTSVALLGRNGAGKSTLLKIIGGTLEADSGGVYSDGTISWPVGFGGSFHGDLTGAQNARFVARIYGIDTDSLVEFVDDFAELGKHFHMPLRSYSSGMRSRLAFGISMGIHFDTYLVDEITAVGDAQFRRKAASVFEQRMKQSSSLFVSHEMRTIRRFCNAGMVLENGQLEYFADVEDAIERHQEIMA